MFVRTSHYSVQNGPQSRSAGCVSISARSGASIGAPAFGPGFRTCYSVWPHWYTIPRHRHRSFACEPYRSGPTPSTCQRSGRGLTFRRRSTVAGWTETPFLNSAISVTPSPPHVANVSTLPFRTGRGSFHRERTLSHIDSLRVMDVSLHH